MTVSTRLTSSRLLVRRPAARGTVLALVLAVVLALLALAAPPTGAVAGAGPGRPTPALRHGGDYLALGDSVTFGFREAANLPTPDYDDAASFVGYPELVAQALKLDLANASCPGETSASLVDAAAPSTGCESKPGGGPGYRTLYPLHVPYAGSQLAFAVTYLRRHPDTRLVTLMIGANDGFLCQVTTADGCASETARLSRRIRAHVSRTLHQLRHRAGYHGQIVIVDYYSLDYADPVSNGFSQLLNAATDQAAAPYHVQVADGYAAFRKAAAQAGGDTCAAGLLTILTTGGCGIHPSVAGQHVLAHAVETQVR